MQGRRADGPQDSVPRLVDVHAGIVSCERCPRLRTYCAEVARVKKNAHRDEIYWGKPVPGFGDPKARVLLIALAPAAHGANRTGRVFTGDGTGGSGDFLMAALHRAGFANIPTSRHPNDGRPHLDAELAALPRIRIVVALGKIAFDAYLQLLTTRGIVIRPRPAFGHGVTYELPNGQRLVGSFHPSRQNTNTGKLTARMMDDIFRAVAGLLATSPDRAGR